MIKDETADHLQTIELDGADPCSPLGAHYLDFSFAPDPEYRGPLNRVEPDEAKALLSEALRYFGIGEYPRPPWPPHSLPFSRDFLIKDEVDEVRDHIEVGFRYAIAALRQEPRRMHNLWDSARDLLRLAERREEDHLAEILNSTDYVAQRKAAEPTHTYFIQEGDTGPIKIGIAAHPIYRLKSLQTGHARLLTIRATCSGGRSCELAYHRQFAAHRLQGEWFAPHPDILAEIDRLNTHSRGAAA